MTGVRRVDDQLDQWEVTVNPTSDEAVTITLPGDRACGTAGAVCTYRDNSPLTNSPSATVDGPTDDALTAAFEGPAGDARRGQHVQLPHRVQHWD